MDGQNANLIATASEFIPSKQMFTTSVLTNRKRARGDRRTPMAVYLYSFVSFFRSQIDCIWWCSRMN